MKGQKTLLQILVELSLIIIGILAALGVQNWRESISERETGREYLINLKEALEADTAMIRFEIKRGFDKEHAAGKLLEMVESNKLVTPEEFENLIENIIVVVNPAFISAVYEDLKYTGNLKLIRNNELKKSLIIYYADADVQKQSMSNSLFERRDFMDLIDYNELTYRQPFSQEVILSRLRKNENAKRDIRELQWTMYYYHNAMIYATLPKSLDLLDKINKELESE